jgi:hypothetical protein
LQKLLCLVDHLNLFPSHSNNPEDPWTFLRFFLDRRSPLSSCSTPFGFLQGKKIKPFPHLGTVAISRGGLPDTPGMPLMMPTKTVVTINSTGRQTASFVRVASAVGWRVRAQVRTCDGLVAEELAALPNVEIVEGDLCQPKADLIPFLNHLFEGAKLAFINTTHWGDEVAIGKACADAAKRAGVTHYIYSSMPDHSVYNPDWRPLPLWSQKFTIENYVRQLGIPATFTYTGIYNNNFTSLAYPLFRMELQEDGSFLWKAPFHPHDPLPWLDAEHDVGPALLQIFKMGPNSWKGQR